MGPKQQMALESLHVGLHCSAHAGSAKSDGNSSFSTFHSYALTVIHFEMRSLDSKKPGPPVVRQCMEDQAWFILAHFLHK